MFTDLAELKDAQESKNPERLIYLADSENPSIRSYVAENPETPLSVLNHLVYDVDPYVRLYILRNLKITNDLCRLLLLDSDNKVKREAMLLALNRYKVGQFDLSQKELFAFIRFLDPTTDNLSLAEVMEKLNTINDGVKSA